MRVEPLPSNAVPISDQESPKPGQDTPGCAEFFEVMGTVSDTAADALQSEERTAAPGVEKNDLRLPESAQAGLAFAYVDSEPRPEAGTPGAQGGRVTTGTKMCHASASDKKERVENSAALPPAQPDGTSAMPVPQAGFPMAPSQSPLPIQHNADGSQVSSEEFTTAAGSSSEVQAPCGPPVNDGALGPLPQMTSTAASASDPQNSSDLIAAVTPGRSRTQDQRETELAAHGIAEQHDAAGPRAPAGITGNQPGIPAAQGESVLRGDDQPRSVDGRQAGLGRPVQGILEEHSASLTGSDLTSADVPAQRLKPSTVADLYGTTPQPERDGAVPPPVSSTPAAEGQEAGIIELVATERGNAVSGVRPAADHIAPGGSGETQPPTRRSHDIGGPGLLSQELQDAAYGRSVVPTSAVDLRYHDSAQKNATILPGPSRQSPEARPVASGNGTDSSSGPAAAKADSNASAPGNDQTAQGRLFQSLPTQTGAAVSAMLGNLRPAQHSGSMTLTFWGADMQTHPYATSPESKALPALLALKQSALPTDPDFLMQLAERIQTQLRAGENIVRIQLKPSTLGRLEIRAETSGSGVQATIFTESTGVKNLLEHNLQILQQSCQEQGLKIDRINIAVQEGLWNQHASSGQHGARSGSGEHDNSGTPASYGDRLEEAGEELTLDTETLAALGPHSTFHTIA